MPDSAKDIVRAELTVEDDYLDQANADWLLPLTHEERDTIQFALALAELRADSEGDTENVAAFGRLYNRVKHNGCVPVEW